MRTGEKLICTVEFSTVPVHCTEPKQTTTVLIEAESRQDAKIQACRLALRVRREAVESDRSLWSIRLWETPCHRVDVDGTLHRGALDSLVLEWHLNASMTLDSILEETAEEAVAL